MTGFTCSYSCLGYGLKTEFPIGNTALIKQYAKLKNAREKIDYKLNNDALLSWSGARNGRVYTENENPETIYQAYDDLIQISDNLSKFYKFLKGDLVKVRI